MAMGINKRKLELEKYYAYYNGREVFDRVVSRRNIRVYSRIILRDIMLSLWLKAPKATGFGASAGIWYKKDEESKNIFYVIVGEEEHASAGQTKPHAPYMAIQNVSDYNTGWIDDGVRASKSKLKQEGFNVPRKNSKNERMSPLLVTVDNPAILSHYVTKEGLGSPSGYHIDVTLLF